MKRTALFAIGLFCLAGCRPAPKTPDQIRQDTANATATAARDTKAVAQGIYDGLRTRGPLNINRATKPQLETLPGIDSAAADRIIAGRPYKNSDELRRRRILSRAEYDRIASKIET
jgi:radical SAM superfamily enzyme with C-terminal helix-hairpin-helix motif